MSANKCCELVSAIRRNDSEKFKVLWKSSKVSRYSILKGGYRLVKAAINQKRITIVRELIKKRVKVNTIERPSNKPLHDAVRLGKLKLVTELVSRGANINSVGINGITPLHIAAKYGHLKIMEFLLNNGANVHSIFLGRNAYGFTPLHFACQGKRIKCIRLLLKFNANVGAAIPHSIEPIHIAVALLDSKMISMLLVNGANVNSRFRDEFYPMLGFNLHYRFEEEDFTLLLCAISMGSIKISKLLLQYGADISMKSYKMSITPLIEAVETNDPKMVKFILDNGGSSQINEHSAKGTSPLHHVIANADTLASPYNDKQVNFVTEKLEIFDILLAAGADLNAEVKDCYGWKILEVAIHFGYRQIVDHIMNKTDFDCSHLNYSTIEISQFHDFMLTDDLITSGIVDDWKYEFKLITYDLHYEILRREAIGLFRDEKTLRRLDQRPDHIDITDAEHQERINEMKVQINQVVREMKIEKIGDSSISFWNLLTASFYQLKNFASNESLQELCLPNYIEKYSLYYDMLEKQLKYALEKGDLLWRADESLEVLLNDFFPLPYYCIKNIVRSFNDEELKSFVSSM